MADDKLEITQEARDAAADIWRDLIAKPGECIAEKQIRVGGAMDQMPLTQTLQRAMTQAAEAAAGRALEAAAKVIEERNRNEGGKLDANAIRSLDPSQIAADTGEGLG
jgi:hypothetical protein